MDFLMLHSQMHIPTLEIMAISNSWIEFSISNMAPVDDKPLYQKQMGDVPGAKSWY